MKVRYSYLRQQFSNCNDLWSELKNFVSTGDFTLGRPLKNFEKNFAKLIGTKYAVGVNSGTDAIKLSLKALGVGSGDEVITAANTFVATVGAINEIGAKPVFVDINENTLCIDTEKVEELITNRTKCIIAMDYDIGICDHDALAEISLRTGIPILHDAAHSFGSSYKGRSIGNQHQYTMFSFDPVKTITCIDGGAIVVKGENAVMRLHAKRLIGMTQPAAQMYTNSRAWTYDIEELGFRYHMSNLHAAVGVSQIKKIEEIIK